MFNLKEFIKKGLLNSVGKMADYQVILNAAGDFIFALMRSTAFIVAVRFDINQEQINWTLGTLDGYSRTRSLEKSDISLQEHRTDTALNR